MDNILQWNNNLILWDIQYISTSGVPGPGPSPWPTSGLVARWALQSNLIDSVNGNNFSVINGTETYSAGHLGNALECKGTDAFSVSGTSVLHDCFKGPGYPVTTSCWVRCTSTSDDNRFIWTGTNGQQLLSSTWSTKALTYAESGGSVEYTDPNRQDEQWHHLVTTYDGTTEKGIAYIDTAESVLTGVYSHWGSRLDVTTEFRISYCDNPAGYFKGQIQLLYVYNKVLSSTDISTLYNGGTGM